MEDFIFSNELLLCENTTKFILSRLRHNLIAFLIAATSGVYTEEQSFSFQTDAKREFINEPFMKLMNKYDVNHYQV